MKQFELWWDISGSRMVKRGHLGFRHPAELDNTIQTILTLMREL